MKHTIETLNASLMAKGMSDYLSAVELDEANSLVLLKDTKYGAYWTDLKSFAPKSRMPQHRGRKHDTRVQSARDKYLGKTVNGLLITDLFYGPDRGYKNRSCYVEYKGLNCGHTGTSTYATLSTHKSCFGCAVCLQTLHGERARIDGILKKRTPTYLYWAAHHKEFPEEHREFSRFKALCGDKPHPKASIEEVGGSLCWVDKSTHADREINMIAIAIRQAFRHSAVFKSCLDKARVETEEGVRYRCAVCSGLFKRTEVQVDHITPVADVNGAPLSMQNMVERIWTGAIQILDRKCHNKKSMLENNHRRVAKKQLRSKTDDDKV